MDQTCLAKKFTLIKSVVSINHFIQKIHILRSRLKREYHAKRDVRAKDPRANWKEPRGNETLFLTISMSN